MACLRLTERCADILLSIRDEIQDAGEHIGEELTMPIEKLVGYASLCFHNPCILISAKLIHHSA